jgi:Protein of unknown function (DUF3421)
MKSRWSFLVLAGRCALALLCFVWISPAQAQESRYRQAISWRDARAPFTPGIGAIIGGPGNSPDPGGPMYICRAQVQGSVTPGKWVNGYCNVAFNGQEVVMSQYQVAYGDALWQPYSGTTYGLLRTGTDSDGTPLFSCRVHYNAGFPQGDQGNQPGKLRAGVCRVPYAGGELALNPPFEVLTSDSGYPPFPSPYPYPPPYPPAQPAYPLPNPSTVTWRSAQAGDTPGPGAIQGGPGYGPDPDAPLYVCRAGTYAGGLFPGKWIQGKCSVPFDGREFKQNKFDVAYGSAAWVPYSGYITPDMIQGGYDTDQTPLYVCRVPHLKMGFGSDKGNQPGYLKSGQCMVSYGSAYGNNPPFEVLVNAPGGGASGGSAGGNVAPATGANGLLVSFDSGTGTTAGTVTVTNGTSGVTVTRQLVANSTVALCLQVLQQAALDAGLQIQTDPKGLKLAGPNNVVQVTGANVTTAPY